MKKASGNCKISGKFGSLSMILLEWMLFYTDCLAVFSAVSLLTACREGRMDLIETSNMDTNIKEKKKGDRQ